VPVVAISNARTQWGVCTEGGRLRLSWRLVHFEPRLSDYVVAHEAAHLVEMNHSKRFWKVVEALYPDWAGGAQGDRDRRRRAAHSLRKDHETPAHHDPRRRPASAL
jgi:predicted metal-dependent hydrolase